MGKMERRRFSREFKLQVLRELESGKSVAEVCREHDLTRFLVARWKREHGKDPDAFQGKGKCKARVDESRTRELERLVGQLYAENDFLKRALANMKKRAEEDRGRGRI